MTSPMPQPTTDSLDNRGNVVPRLDAKRCGPHCLLCKTLSTSGTKVKTIISLSAKATKPSKKVIEKTLKKAAPVKSKTIQDRFDALFEKLVPEVGKAKTLEGEILRAVARLSYRFSNDGDMFTEGYGCETCGPSAAYLLHVGGPRIKGAVHKMIAPSDYGNEKSYRRALDALISTTVDFVEEKAGKYTEGNTLDSRSAFKSMWAADNGTDDEE